MTTQSPAAASVMDIHSCSYYCQLPKCVLRQRDELVRVYVEGWKEKEPTTPPAVEGGLNFISCRCVEGSREQDLCMDKRVCSRVTPQTVTPPGEAVIGDTHEERAHVQTIDERDHAYEIIDDILDLVLGSDRPEWSSAYDFTDAVHDVAEHVEALTKQAAQVGVNLATCDWPAKPFSVKDEPGEHDPCYLVMPDGSMVAFNHHAENGVDQARAQFVAIACNEALAKRAVGVVPVGFVLVPGQMHVDADAWEAASFAFGGPATGEGEAYMDCTLWVGEIDLDDGGKLHGLHVSCDECPEEGCITLAEFPAAPTPAVEVTEEEVTAACGAFYNDEAWRTNANKSRDYMRDALLAAKAALTASRKGG